MPEIKPDLDDPNRCLSVHWSLPTQCALPRGHSGNWHEAWHPQTRERIRYRRSMGTYRTQERDTLDWRDLEIPPPGEICGEPHGTKRGVFCQEPRKHNEITWSHRALFEGCTYTWNTLRREPTASQVALDLVRTRQMAVEQAVENARLKQELAAVDAEIADFVDGVRDDPGTPAVVLHMVELLRRARGATPAPNLDDAAALRRHITEAVGR